MRALVMIRLTMSRQHESEKQHRCMYCNNRFKNKNEAERHQNSLHLRRHSWSCAALAANYESAFFPSSEVNPPANNVNQSQPAQVTSDTCGYCGAEFPNDPPNWDERVKHLDGKHKFRECNQSKKFFRADHFRQHLKHSHAGASGKWTNRLEGACIKDEPHPQPLDAHGNPANPTQGAPVANMGGVPSQAEIKHEPLASPGMGQVHLNSQAMPPGSMQPPHPEMASQAMAHMDMRNIDPSIGTSQLGGSPMVGNMHPMTPSH